MDWPINSALEKAKPLTPDCLPAEGVGAPGQQDLRSLLRRYGTSKTRNYQMAGHLISEGFSELGTRLYRCCSFLRFRHYLVQDETRLVESRSCFAHLLCPLCAVRRSARTLRRYLERCQYLAPSHDFYLVTFTVRNGHDLAERYEHLMSSWRRLSKRAAKGYGVFSEAAGAFCSIEFTKSAKGWHPHMHMIWAMPKGSQPLRWGKDSQLAQDWFAVTGDSYIVHAQRIVAGEGGPRSGEGPLRGDPLTDALCEVLKYALKFSSLSLEDNLHAYWTLKGKRLTRSYGCFFGLELPETEPLDDEPLDGPYLELFFRYCGSRGYVLESGCSLSSS